MATILEEKTRAKLEQLMLIATKVRSGAIKGDRRSIKRGTSIEFADYRNYAPGDDLRRLDWNIYARTERPYIKVLEDEEDLAVHILLDSSSSMDWPDDNEGYNLPEDAHKLLYGKRLAAGLAYISLTTNDRMTLSAVNQGNIDSFGPARGRGQGVPMLRFVQNIDPGGVTDINDMLNDYAIRSKRPGLLFLISDMFSPSGYIDGFNALLGRGYEIVLLHVMSPDEIIPPLVGDLRLIDIETGVAQEISMESGLRDIYVRRVEAWRDEIRAECVRRGVHYVPVVTDYAWEKVILYDLRRMGLVK